MIRRPSLLAGLGVGVFAASWAAIFIRWAHATPLVISAYRLVLAAAPLLLLAIVWRFAELRRLSLGRWCLLVGSGIALSFHFGTWIASLSFTTVASSVALVSTQPIWVALLSVFVLRERIGRRELVGSIVAVCGALIISGADFSVRGPALWGDFLALAGAWFAAIYFIVGRSVRPTLSLLSYTAIVYGVAGAMSALTLLISKERPENLDAITWWMIALLALVPQLIGHSLLNWALKYVSAPLVSVAVLGEPVVSTVLAYLLLREEPGAVRLAGGAVTLAGVYWASTGSPEGGP